MTLALAAGDKRLAVVPVGGQRIGRRVLVDCCRECEVGLRKEDEG